VKSLTVTHEIRATSLKYRLDLTPQYFHLSEMLEDSHSCFNYLDINSPYFSALTKPYAMEQITEVQYKPAVN